MLRLNNEVLVEIFSFLSVIDQIHLSKLNRRFGKLLLKYFWMPKYRNITTSNVEMQYFEANPKVYEMLVPYVRKLMINEEADWDFYFARTYPKLHDFTQMDSDADIDDLMLKAAPAIPAVESLNLNTAHPGGDGISDLHTLQHIFAGETPLRAINLMSILDGRIQSLTHLDLCAYVEATPLEVLFSDVVKQSLTNLSVPYSVMSFNFVDLVKEMELSDLRWEMRVSEARNKVAASQQLPPWAFFHKTLAETIYEMRFIKTKNMDIYHILNQGIPFLRELTRFHFKYIRTEYSVRHLCNALMHNTLQQISVTDAYDGERTEESSSTSDDGFRRYGVPDFDFNGLHKLLEICPDLHELNVRFLLRDNVENLILAWLSELIPMLEDDYRGFRVKIRFECLKFPEKTRAVVRTVKQSQIYRKQNVCVIECCTREFSEDDHNEDLIEYRFYAPIRKGISCAADRDDEDESDISDVTDVDEIVEDKFDSEDTDDKDDNGSMKDEADSDDSDDYAADMEDEVDSDDADDCAADMKDNIDSDDVEDGVDAADIEDEVDSDDVEDESDAGSMVEEADVGNMKYQADADNKENVVGVANIEADPGEPEIKRPRMAM